MNNEKGEKKTDSYKSNRKFTRNIQKIVLDMIEGLKYVDIVVADAGMGCFETTARIIYR